MGNGERDTKRTTLDLDDEDLIAIDIIMRRFGFRQETAAIRYAIRAVAMAEHMSLKLPEPPPAKE